MEIDVADLSPAKAYHLLTHAVAPRPIAWVTSLHGDVVNAAPFSWFQAICADPPMIMLSIVDDPDRPDGRKDTARNILAGGEFVVHIARGSQLQALVDCSAPLAPEQSELVAGGLTTEPSHKVAPPRITGVAAALECRLVEHHRYGRDKATTVLVGEVVHAAIADDLLTDRGMLDVVKAQVPARLGGADYLRVTTVEQVARQS